MSKLKPVCGPPHNEIQKLSVGRSLEILSTFFCSEDFSYKNLSVLGIWTGWKIAAERIYEAAGRKFDMPGLKYNTRFL